jgi:FtsH-binding integral membrane protein
VLTFPDMNYARPRARVASSDAANDALWVTYRWMTLGLAVTGATALLIASTPDAIGFLLHNPILFYGLMFAEIGLVVAFSSLVTRVSTAAAAAMFFGYAALTGVTFSTLFLAYTASSIAATFFVTAGAFAGLSIFGAATRADLSAVGRFGMFALIGLVLASVVNIFLHSSGLDWLITFVGVLLFAALTAYDTQRLKVLFQSQTTTANLPLAGALTLYLDFINMFLFLLRLFGDRRRN